MSERLRVLVIDDSRSAYALARELLTEANPAGYEVTWAASYDEGLAAVRAGAVDAALVDYHLGAVTGVDFMRQASADECRIPLILLTSRGDERVDLEALAAGAADYVDKVGVSGSTLDRAIGYAVRHQRTLELLRRREERFRALLESSADAIMLLDRDALVLYASESVNTVSGVAPADAVGRSAFDFIHPDDAPLVRSVLAGALARPGVAIRTTYRARLRDGSSRHREGVFTNRLDNPAVGAIVLNFHDVTDRKLAEAQQAHLAAIVRSSDDAIVGLSLDGTILSWNPGAQRLWGYTPAEAVGRPASLVIPTRLAGEFESLLQLARDGRRVQRYESERVRKDGATIHVSVTLSPMYAADGTVSGLSSVARDISERLRTEQAVRAAEERTRFTLEMAQIGLWDADLVTRRAHWSETMAAVTGLPVERFPRTYEEFAALVHAEDRPNLSQAFERALGDGGRFIAEFRMAAGDGTVRWHESKGRVFTDEVGVPVRALGVAIDVTERKQLEEQFRQAQKMEAIGHLAGGVAHDFNNVLTAILGYCEFVLKAVAGQPEVVADVREIRQAGERAARLTKQLLAFGRRQHVEPRVFTLNRLMRDTEKMLARVIGEDVQLEFVQDRAAGPIKADPGQIEQVLLNLALNARDAMPAGGQLTIATADVTLDADFVRRHPGSAAGRHTCLVVSDTGCGMSPDVSSHIFEPFYTTKELGKGTGLGLSTVFGIVKQSGGYIAVESSPGAGTTFRVYFPVVNAPLDSTAPPAAAPRQGPQNETILLVEDEPPVRAVIAKTLMRAGYRVLIADDPGHAAAIAQSHEGPIHLLLSDVIMPQMSGPDLAQRLVTRRPEMGVLYVSGFADSLGIALGARSARTAFLHKPFTGAALSRKVREQLDGRS